MPRARNIKPGFAKNEDLAECSIAARLCFALLPTLADRAGRLEDRPKRIKGELFAFDSIEVEPLLAELAKHGFIERYVVDGRGLIQIIAFHKHQNPHHREPESALPPHPSLRLDADGKYVKPEATPPLQPPSAPGKPEALPPTVDIARGSNRVDSGALIPDTGTPTPRKRGTVHGFPPGFEAFWTAYPKKAAKNDAAKAFAKLAPDGELLAVLLAAVREQADSPGWRKDGGQFIPNAATWLNGRRWEDELSTVSNALSDIFAGAT